MSQKNSLILLFIAASSALVFAYISQYFFGLQPCQLCHYQRVPFFLIILILAANLRFKKLRNLAMPLCLLMLLINVVIAFYHVGVEQKIFAGLSSCSSNLNSFSNIDELRQALINAKAVRCDEPQFIFLNLSMAAWNLIYCSALALYLFLNLKSRTNIFRTIDQKQVNRSRK